MQWTAVVPTARITGMRAISYKFTLLKVEGALIVERRRLASQPREMIGALALDEEMVAVAGLLRRFGDRHSEYTKYMMKALNVRWHQIAKAETGRMNDDHIDLFDCATAEIVFWEKPHAEEGEQDLSYATRERLRLIRYVSNEQRALPYIALGVRDISVIGSAIAQDIDPELLLSLSGTGNSI